MRDDEVKYRVELAVLEYKHLVAHASFPDEFIFLVLKSRWRLVINSSQHLFEESRHACLPLETRQSPGLTNPPPGLLHFLA